MFLVSEANCFCEKKTVFLSNIVNITAAVIVLDFGRGWFGCGGGDEATDLQY